MTKQTQIAALALAGALGMGAVAPTAAHASAAGKRNTAYVLGAATVYGIVKKNPTIAGVAGAGAAYSYISSLKDAKKEREKARQAKLRQSRFRRARYQAACCRPAAVVCQAPPSRPECDDDHEWKHGKGAPPGWSHGKKVGWGGGHMPPGQAKKCR
jgi:hypothetical protein